MPKPMRKTDAEHKSESEWIFEDKRVIECLSCGFTHLYPFPSSDDLCEYYRHKYHKDKWAYPYDSITDDVLAEHIQRALSNKEFVKIFETVKSLITNKNNLSMIDIGSANLLLGLFFKNESWDVKILEPNVDACEYQSRAGMDVLNAELNSTVSSELQKFDFINLQFVLEHVLDPVGYLMNTRKLMHNDSILRIAVPNDFSPSHLAWLTMSNNKPSWVSYPDHINYFNFRTLTCLLNKLGFKEVSRTTSFPLDLLLLFGSDFYNRNDIKVGQIVSDFEESWEASKQSDYLTKFYRSMADLGLGRSIILYLKLK